MPGRHPSRFRHPEAEANLSDRARAVLLGQFSRDGGRVEPVLPESDTVAAPLLAKAEQPPALGVHRFMALGPAWPAAIGIEEVIEPVNIGGTEPEG
jgi:hypothetical protein